jgi:hypothetical protein
MLTDVLRAGHKLIAITNKHRFSRRFNRHINIRILAPASHLN